jgi:hypothetical protein
MYTTTASLLLGPVHRPMGGEGTVLASHALLLEEGSRARWRLIDLGGGQVVVAGAKTPDNLLAQGLLLFLASRDGAPALEATPRLEPLAGRSADGTRFTTRMPHAAVQDVLGAWPVELGLIVTRLPGTSIGDEDVARLIEPGVWVKEPAGVTAPRA